MLFISEPNKPSVISLDYSNDGSYLSSVYENGLINIFGLMTKFKSQSITLDKESTLTRFHPTKQFHLAVASYKGAVTVYDIAAKKITYQDKNAHDAPCRDVAMPVDIPYRLLTCGCDSLIKIYDMRKRSVGLQIQSYCGLSTISVSKCGGFFASGNLKGDVLTYDIRDLKKPLAKIKVGNELVTRVAFLPEWEEVDSTFFTVQRVSEESAASDELPDTPEAQDDYTINDLIAIKKGRTSEFDISCSSRVSAISSQRGTGDDRRISELFGQNIANAFKDVSFNISDTGSPRTPEIVNNVENARRVGKKDSISKRRSSYMPSPLQLIHEELSDKENIAGSLNTPSGFSEGGPRFSSTPASSVKFNIKSKMPAPSEEQEEDEDSEEIIDVDALDSFTQKAKPEGSDEKQATVVGSAPVSDSPQIDFKKEFEALQKGIEEKIRFEVQSLNFDLNGRHMEMMTYIYNQRRNLENRIKVIEECMAFMMNDDAKIARVMELQDENRDLRQQLGELTNRMMI